VWVDGGNQGEFEKAEDAIAEFMKELAKDRKNRK
jgi:hypothetical protein